MRCSIFGLVLAVVLSSGASAQQINPPPGQEPTREFSARERQTDLAALKNFVYPPGYSDEAIISLENGVVPANLSVPDFLRLHCGEMSQNVLNPCLLRHGAANESVYTVVTLGGTKTFATFDEARVYYQTQMDEIVTRFQNEVMTMNDFIDHFCTETAAGKNPRDILAARGGRPRLPHAIAPPNADAKYPFSNFFQWEKCVNCVGIIAINQPMHAPSATCASLRKQGQPRVSYFVVDKNSSRGHRSLDDGIEAFEETAKQSSL